MKEDKGKNPKKKHEGKKTLRFVMPKAPIDGIKEKYE